MSVQDAFAVVRDLHNANALHRKGFRLGEVAGQAILNYAMREIDELSDAPDDIEELADIMNCLAHYAALKGWTRELIEAAMIRKMRARVSVT